ncbi:MAG: LytTR family transcriptional regulator [Oscillospiraceae bacterium]|jgi:DNA-binding LytR/AlgR family response regulator|nr:LytTR family transcriptional regulator [Oscillospiraceae bacterium]
MQIEIRIDAACLEPRVEVTAASAEEAASLVRRLSEDGPPVLAGFLDGALAVLTPAEIIRVYTEGGKVFAVSPKGIYTLRLRLYEAEERLEREGFIRISNAELVNLKKTVRFDLSLAGTICVLLEDGTVSYASRRFVPKIKKILGL